MFEKFNKFFGFCLNWFFKVDKTFFDCVLFVLSIPFMFILFFVKFNLDIIFNVVRGFLNYEFKKIK